jgi:twinkle protein
MTSQVLKREQCPDCLDTSQDNLIVYEDGGKYCFSCGELKEKGERDDMLEHEPKVPAALLNGEYADLPSRGISKHTCQRFEYQTGKHNGTYVHIANYLDSEGKPIAQKIRTKDKQMYWKGDASKVGFYGQWMYEPGPNKNLIIVEGEIDALTVRQVLGNKVNCVVSIPSGTNSAVKTCKANMEWLLRWGSIYLAFDSDEAGRKAQAEVADLFDPTVIKFVTWPMKDPNELLVSGRGGDIITAIQEAKDNKPQSIIQASDIMGSILSRPEYGTPWPWPTLTQATYGIHPNKIYTIGAGSGIGKTEFLINLVGHFTHDLKEPLGGLFLESSPAEIYLRTAGWVLGQRLHIPGQEWDEESIQRTVETFQDTLYLYDLSKEGSSGSSWDSVKAKIIYMVKGLGIKYIILDHLTALACHFKDERKELDRCMAELGALVHQLGCTVFLVSHLAKPSEGPGYEEGRMVTANAFRGSQSIQYWSAFMLGLERNKLAEDPTERQLTKVRVLKDRFSGEADGLTLHLKYNTLNGRLEEENHEDDVI